MEQAPLRCLLLETDEPSAPQTELNVSSQTPGALTSQVISAPLKFALAELSAHRDEPADVVASSIRNLSATLLQV